MQADMESCAAVEVEINKVLTRFDSVNRHSQNTLGNVIQSLETIQQELMKRQSQLTEVDGLDANLSEGQKSIILESLKKIKETSKSVSTQHKDLHSSVSKVGKVIDKNFVSEYSPVPKGFEDEEKIIMINEVICEYLLRQGRLSVAESLIREGKLEVTDEMKLPFLEMHEIIEGLQVRSLAPALSWAERNHEALEKRDSWLEFGLHRMNFLQLLDSGTEHSRTDALRYAKCFQMFSVTYAKEIQQLMGCFLFQYKGLSNSPYANLLSTDAWQQLEEQFAKDACFLLGLPLDSPLTICVNAGATTLGPLIHITKVMLQKQLALDWGPKEELPVGIDLGNDSLFHSVFACPILRRHGSDNNPPMKLNCGHVVSKDAINQLFNGQKLKCPYCPAEQTLTETLRLHL